MRYAIVLNGVVDNVVIWDGQGDIPGPHGAIAVLLTNQTCNLGWIYDGTTFIEPEEP